MTNFLSSYNYLKFLLKKKSISIELEKSTDGMGGFSINIKSDLPVKLNNVIENLILNYIDYDHKKIFNDVYYLSIEENEINILANVIVGDVIYDDFREGHEDMFFYFRSDGEEIINVINEFYNTHYTYDDFESGNIKFIFSGVLYSNHKFEFVNDLEIKFLDKNFEIDDINLLKRVKKNNF